ncbi:MAG: ParB N-terminal domain-containing protein, partial [Deltaproteobacteria bacterium]|nr:ParB N-terminal domain-containing protein [Deltaproteobacteria bacterium]
KHGLLNPILVRAEADGTFITLAGSRRRRAYRHQNKLKWIGVKAALDEISAASNSC